MVECWKCPLNTVDKCQKDSKYCRRYTTKLIGSSNPSDKKEVEKIREQERLFWNIKE